MHQVSDSYQHIHSRGVLWAEKVQNGAAAPPNYGVYAVEDSSATVR